MALIFEGLRLDVRLVSLSLSESTLVCDIRKRMVQECRSHILVSLIISISISSTVNQAEKAR